MSTNLLFEPRVPVRQKEKKNENSPYRGAPPFCLHLMPDMAIIVSTSLYVAGVQNSCSKFLCLWASANMFFFDFKLLYY